MKSNDNSWRKSCKFHKNSNYTAATILDFTEVDRFQLLRSSLPFDQHDGSYQKMLNAISAYYKYYLHSKEIQIETLSSLFKKSGSMVGKTGSIISF